MVRVKSDKDLLRAGWLSRTHHFFADPIPCQSAIWVRKHGAAYTVVAPMKTVSGACLV